VPWIVSPFRRAIASSLVDPLLQGLGGGVQAHERLGRHQVERIAGCE